MDEAILQAWTEKLPGCKRFLENFFGTCNGFSPEVNYLNYVEDLRVYSPTNRCIRENSGRLVEAFYEITGIEVAELELRVESFYRLEK